MDWSKQAIDYSGSSSQSGLPQCGQVLTFLADLMVFLRPLTSSSIFLRRFLFLFFLGTESSLTILSRSFLILDSKTGTKFSTMSPLFAIELSTDWHPSKFNHHHTLNS